MDLRTNGQQTADLGTVYDFGDVLQRPPAPDQPSAASTRRRAATTANEAELCCLFGNGLCRSKQRPRSSFTVVSLALLPSVSTDATVLYSTATVSYYINCIRCLLPPFGPPSFTCGSKTPPNDSRTQSLPASGTRTHSTPASAPSSRCKVLPIGDARVMFPAPRFCRPRPPLLHGPEPSPLGRAGACGCPPTALPAVVQQLQVDQNFLFFPSACCLDGCWEKGACCAYQRGHSARNVQSPLSASPTTLCIRQECFVGFWLG